MLCLVKVSTVSRHTGRGDAADVHCAEYRENNGSAVINTSTGHGTRSSVTIRPRPF